jgi:hypothetical protein
VRLLLSFFGCLRARADYIVPNLVAGGFQNSWGDGLNVKAEAEFGPGGSDKIAKARKDGMKIRRTSELQFLLAISENAFIRAIFCRIRIIF